MNKLVDARYGQFIYPDKDMYVGRSLEKYGEYSYFEATLLKSLITEGDVVIDVGANIGALTVPLAQAAGPGGYVVAFEPQQYLYYTLCGNVALNNLYNTHVFQRIVSDVNDEIRTIPVFDYEKEGNFGAMSANDVTGEAVLASPVKTISIDALQLTFAKLIKIDVEGAELEVLKGAVNTIQRSNSYLYVECTDVEHAHGLLEFFDSISYDYLFHQPPMFNSNNFFGNKVDILGEGILEDEQGRKPQVVSGNILAFPKGEAVIPTDDFFVEFEDSLIGKSIMEIRNGI